MRAQYLVPVWLAAVILLPLLVACAVLLVRRPRQRWAWLRRLLMVVLLAVVAVRPVTPLEGQQTQRMNADVFFVVDRTGSMNAEDYDGTHPRLDGVRADMRQVMSMTRGARYSIIGFDSTATRQLPLTTDAGAVSAWIDTVTTEPTAYSRGSSVDRPLDTLLAGISEASREDPSSHVLVYLLTDGESTDGRAPATFAPAAQYVDGGAVLGYGTAAGGPMKARGGEQDGRYITDSSGARGLSHIDEQQLQLIAGQMGVPYFHRTAPGQDMKASMQGITLHPVPTTNSSRVPAFRDWYWIAAIPLAALMIWELGALTYRLPRRLEREDIRSSAAAGPLTETRGRP